MQAVYEAMTAGRDAKEMFRTRICRCRKRVDRDETRDGGVVACLERWLESSKMVAESFANGNDLK